MSIDIPAVRVSDLALVAIFNRMSDPVSGLNPLFRQQAVLYGIDPNFLQVDFLSSDSPTFCFGQIEPDLLESSGNLNYPFCTLYVLESGQTNETKFTTFSGIVRVVMDIWISWRPIRGLRDFEKFANCIESAVISIMNELLKSGGQQNQDWGKPLVYNGNVQCKRAPISMAGDNWRQRIGFSFLVGLHTGP